MDAVVVRLSSVAAAGPTESNRLQPRVVNPSHLLRGRVFGIALDVHFDEADEPLALVVRHRARRQSDRGPDAGAAAGPRDDVRRSGRVYRAPIHLLIVQRLEQAPRGILFLSQDAKSFMRPAWDSRRVRPKEGRRNGNLASVYHRSVQRKMVPFDSPSPGLRSARISEYAEVIQSRRTVESDRPRAGFQISEYRLVRDDRAGLADARGAEAGRRQGVRRVRLPLRHISVFQSRPRSRDVVPVLPFVRIERELRNLPLGRIQAVDERPRRAGDTVDGGGGGSWMGHTMFRNRRMHAS